MLTKIKDLTIDFLKWSIQVAIGIPFAAVALFLAGVVAKFLFRTLIAGWNLL